MEVYARLESYIAANKPVAMATVISGPRAGAKIVVPGKDAPEGGIHPDLDGEIVATARRLLASEDSETLDYEADGEKIPVFIESFPPPQRLIVVGGVHVAIPLHRLAKILGYHVTVVEPRRYLASAARFPQADRIVVEWPDEALRGLALDSGCSVVVLTHDPKFDQPALIAALNSEARYVGAIGSRGTNEQRAAELRAQGLTPRQLARIHAPIGLDLGAQTPAEIALAIMAEVVAARRGRSGGRLRRPTAAEMDVEPPEYAGLTGSGGAG